MLNNKVDISDLKYQANKNFLPDKRILWKMSESETGWVIAHNAIREEIKSMKNTLDKLILPIKKWQIECIQKWWDGHYIHIIEHHKNEDEQLNPFIKSNKTNQQQTVCSAQRPLIVGADVAPASPCACRDRPFEMSTSGTSSFRTALMP